MNKLFKIFTTILLIFALNLTSLTTMSLPAFAEESVPPAPTAPPAATAPPTEVQAPAATTAPQSPATPKPAATAKPATTLAPTASAQATTAPQQAQTPKPAKTAQPSVADEPDETPAPATSSAPTAGVSTGSQNGNSQSGDSSVTTGDANVNGSVVNEVNSNITQGSGTGSNGGATAANAGNGTDSSNNATSNTSSSSDQELQNAANLSNDVHIGAVSGNNTASRNTGDGEVVTGDANVGVTVINGANNNISGLDVNQYDVNGNQSGDIVLGSTAPTVSCGSNGTTCSNGVVGSTAKNTANGDSSANNAATNSNSSSAASMSNEADVVNDVVIDAVTGSNKADSNVGQGSIQTGDANVAVTVLNFLNNNIIAGTVDVINIFGNYVGNIIIPESTAVAGNNAAGNNAAGNHVSNTGNGDTSDNNATANSSNNNATTQANLADIDNNLTVNANTGENDTKSNTNGQNKIESGSTNVDANIYNVANVNSNDGGYIVLVNDNGVWRGTIYGGKTNGSTAASEGVEFEVKPDGTVVASNQGNGTQSDNNAQANSSNNSTTTQTNDAKVANNVTINADTGHNSASRNTGGGAIKTGDVNVGASIMNFVNNNFVGKTFRVVLVNVMGSWNGSVVAPGAQAPAAQGGAQQTANQPKPSATPAQASTTPAPSAVVQSSSQPLALNSGNVNAYQGAVLGKMIVKTAGNQSGKQGAEIVLDNGQKFYVDDTLGVPEDKPIVAAAVGVNSNASDTASNYWIYALALIPILAGATAIVIRKRKATIEV